MSRRTERLRALYGASPLHLLLVLCSFALTLYAGLWLLKGDTLGVVLWFVGAALLHDLVFLPLYTVTDRALRAVLRPRVEGADRVTAVPGRVNYLRVPAFLSLLLLLVWYPLILRTAPGRYSDDTGLDSGVFLGRWLLITAALFAISVLCLLVGALRARGRGPGGRTARGRTAFRRPAFRRRARRRLARGRTEGHGKRGDRTGR